MLALNLGLALFGASLPLLTQAQTYSATYSPSNAPDHSEKGQTGTNACGTGNNQTSECQNVYGAFTSTFSILPFTFLFSCFP